MLGCTTAAAAACTHVVGGSEGQAFVSKPTLYDKRVGVTLLALPQLVAAVHVAQSQHVPLPPVPLCWFFSFSNSISFTAPPLGPCTADQVQGGACWCIDLHLILSWLVQAFSYAALLNWYADPLTYAEVVSRRRHILLSDLIILTNESSECATSMTQL